MSLPKQANLLPIHATCLVGTRGDSAKPCQQKKMPVELRALENVAERKVSGGLGLWGPINTRDGTQPGDAGKAVGRETKAGRLSSLTVVDGRVYQPGFYSVKNSLFSALLSIR